MTSTIILIFRPRKNNLGSEAVHFTLTQFIYFQRFLECFVFVVWHSFSLSFVFFVPHSFIHLYILFSHCFWSFLSLPKCFFNHPILISLLCHYSHLYLYLTLYCILFSTDTRELLGEMDGIDVLLQQLSVRFSFYSLFLVTTPRHPLSLKASVIFFNISSCNTSIILSV